MPLPNDVIAKLAECAHSNFESARDIWFGRGTISTVVVAVGLALELPELWYELKSIAREHIPCLKYQLVLVEKRVHLAKVIAFVGWMLIVGGVVGEGYTGSRVNDLDARIQGCSTARLTEATLNAAEANERSRNLEHDNIELRKELAKEERKTAEAQEEAAQLQEDFRYSSNFAFKKTGNRIVNTLEFRKALKGKPRGHVEMWIYIDNWEAHQFGFAIWNTLKRAHWDVSPIHKLPPAKEPSMDLGLVLGRQQER